MKSSCTHQYKFQSIGQRYKGPGEQDFLLKIVEHGNDILEVNIFNKKYINQRNSLYKQLGYLTFLGVILIYMKISYNICLAILNFPLVMWIMVLIFLLFTSVHSEGFIYCHNFGLQLQVKTLLGQNNYFIEASKIHDIVINEVLENFDFYYLLIVRTAGNLFHKKPIIPVFKYLKPSGDCLHLIYQHLKRVMHPTS